MNKYADAFWHKFCESVAPNLDSSDNGLRGSKFVYLFGVLSGFRFTCLTLQDESMTPEARAGLLNVCMKDLEEFIGLDQAAERHA